MSLTASTYALLTVIFVVVQIEVGGGYAVGNPTHHQNLEDVNQSQSSENQTEPTNNFITNFLVDADDDDDRKRFEDALASLGFNVSLISSSLEDENTRRARRHFDDYASDRIWRRWARRRFGLPPWRRYRGYRGYGDYFRNHCMNGWHSGSKTVACKVFEAVVNGWTTIGKF